jgi:peptidoglycan/xylan/chitin deacetylase (PgdA/CDA1 family)
MGYFIRYGKLFDVFFPKRIWRMPDHKVYLTFDDGPTDNLTSGILKILADRGIQATFFCVGENIVSNQEMIEELINHGHTIANHTHRHLDAHKVPSDQYLADVMECQASLQRIGIRNDLFRPPHGKLGRSLVKRLHGEFKIIMWSFLSGDFDKRRTVEQIVSSAKRVRNGDVIVFHDNLKFKEKILASLPAFLDELKARKFVFGTL